MKACPYCKDTPLWSFARMYSRRNKDGDHYLFCSCIHATQRRDFTRDSDRRAIETAWDAEAEKLFERYTEGWTDLQRSSFRERLWPTPPPPSELFDRYRNEQPTMTPAGARQPYADNEPF